MKIKTKLRLGFGFLFVVVIFFGAISLYYMNKISVSSKVILKDNYESLRYTREMRAILDDNELPLSETSVIKFAVQLSLEEKNVTEKGEGQAVTALAEVLSAINAPGADLSVQRQALKKRHLQLRIIDELNMQAIVRKNDAAQQSVEKAASYLIFAAIAVFSHPVFF